MNKGYWTRFSIYEKSLAAFFMLNIFHTAAGLVGKQKAVRRWNEAWVCVLASSVG